MNNENKTFAFSNAMGHDIRAICPQSAMVTSMLMSLASGNPIPTAALNGQLKFLQALDKDEYVFILTWLSAVKFNDLFPEDVCDLISIHIKCLENNPVENALTYLLRRFKSTVTVTGAGHCGGLEMTSMLFEVLHNAVKYAASYIHLDVGRDTIICKNDYTKHDSGTQKGLALHGIQLIRNEEDKTVSVTVPLHNNLDESEEYALTLESIEALAVDCGWSIVPNLPQMNQRLVRAFDNQLPMFDTVEEKAAAVDFIKAQLSAHLDSTAPIIITVNDYGLNMSIDHGYVTMSNS